MVRVGSSAATCGGSTFYIKNVIKHPEYRAITQMNDIALVEIDGQFQYSKLINQIKMADVLYQTSKYFDLFGASGYGSECFKCRTKEYTWYFQSFYRCV